ncbi:OLC1v1036219C1 [Oldenlandia corymbosa var. corymbosa]|uniref:OLC1v1036219C1 n=1 Tax=Oldenlandia corymbosa var. corymbosa TaxID=529605 RepID=A0AAV1CUU0_OLDCO|nr:OLC1v1036219C1 [Oldenlandia corymbosa var. corymbosa]
MLEVEFNDQPLTLYFQFEKLPIMYFFCGRICHVTKECDERLLKGIGLNKEDRWGTWLIFEDNQKSTPAASRLKPSLEQRFQLEHSNPDPETATISDQITPISPQIRSNLTTQSQQPTLNVTAPNLTQKDPQPNPDSQLPISQAENMISKHMQIDLPPTNTPNPKTSEKKCLNNLVPTTPNSPQPTTSKPAQTQEPPPQNQSPITVNPNQENITPNRPNRQINIPNTPPLPRNHTGSTRKLPLRTNPASPLPKRKLFNPNEPVSKENLPPLLPTPKKLKPLPQAEQAKSSKTKSTPQKGEALEACMLDDLGHDGSMYTWFRNRKFPDTIKVRLDGACGNDLWRQRFPETEVLHLFSHLSNHLPILVVQQPCHGHWRKQKKKRRFRFESCWIRRSNIEEAIKNSWTNEDNDLLGKISNYAIGLVNWEKNYPKANRKEIENLRTKVESMQKEY